MSHIDSYSFFLVFDDPTLTPHPDPHPSVNSLDQFQYKTGSIDKVIRTYMNDGRGKCVEVVVEVDVCRVVVELDTF